MKNFSKWFSIGTFLSLYVLTSLISTIHVVEFFEISNPRGMAITLAIAFELGAAASLASIISLNKMNKTIVWCLFILLTAMQAMGNTYYTYVHATDYMGWIELFGLNNMDSISQKRILAIISGAILPIVALGFIKALVDYMRPETEKKVNQERSNEIKEEIDENESLYPQNFTTTDEIIENKVEEIEEIEEIENEVEHISKMIDEAVETRDNSNITKNNIEEKIKIALQKNPELKDALKNEMGRLEEKKIIRKNNPI